MNIHDAMKHTPAVKKAIAYREAQLRDKPVVDNAKRAVDEEAPKSALVMTKNAADLKGMPGRLVAEGVFEVMAVGGQDFPKGAVVVDDKPAPEEPAKPEVKPEAKPEVVPAVKE